MIFLSVCKQHEKLVRIIKLKHSRRKAELTCFSLKKNARQRHTLICSIYFTEGFYHES